MVILIYMGMFQEYDFYLDLFYIYFIVCYVLFALTNSSTVKTIFYATIPSNSVWFGRS